MKRQWESGVKKAESQGELIKMTYLCEISRTYGEASERIVESKGDGRTLAGRGGTDLKPIPPLNFTHSFTHPSK